MAQNTESGVEWLLAMETIKSVSSLFAIFVCGFVLQEQFGHPIKSSWFTTWIRSIGTGLGFLGIAFIPSIIFEKNILQLINDLQLIGDVGSLFRAYFLMTMILFYFPLFFVFFVILKCYNKYREKREDAEMGRPLFK